MLPGQRRTTFLANEESPLGTPSPGMAAGLLAHQGAPSFLDMWVQRWWLKLESIASCRLFVGGFLSNPPSKARPFQKENTMFHSSVPLT